MMAATPKPDPDAPPTAQKVDELCAIALRLAQAAATETMGLPQNERAFVVSAMAVMVIAGTAPNAGKDEIAALTAFLMLLPGVIHTFPYAMDAALIRAMVDSAAAVKQ